MPLLKAAIAKVRVYLTRSRTKQARAQQGGGEDTTVKAVDVPCNVEPLVKRALAEGDRRDEEEIGDDEEGDEFDYPPDPSEDTSAPAAAPTKVFPPPTNPSGRKIKYSRRAIHAFHSAKPAQTATGKHLTAGPDRRNRRQRHDALKQGNHATRYKVRSSMSLRLLEETKSYKMDFNIAHSRVARGAYIGVRQPQDDKLKTLGELLNDGFKLVEWDGIETLLLVDSQKRVVGILAGRPNGADDMEKTLEEFEAAMNEAKAKMHFGTAQNRRGPYATAAYGVSYGGGQMRPGMLRHSAHNTRVLKELFANPAVQRVAHFANACFALYAPKLYADYHHRLRVLYRRFNALCYVFPHSVFPAVSCNFGPNATTRMHLDHANRAVGLCAIFAAGNYNHVLGGHLILHDFRLVVQFPRGATALIPSATCRHGNTAIQDGETRTVLTQYAAGGLFRYMEYEFMTWKALVARRPAMAEFMKEGRAMRWERELQLYSKVDELHSDRIAARVATV